jgi:methyl-accepting chemotaxis protein
MTQKEQIEKLTGLVERLAERTDAIAQSLELLSSLHQETERRMQRLAEMVGNIGNATDGLISIVHNHENRLNALEG